jgi:TRAP-type C4-dicarboxylate transport system permease small subunit
MVVVVLIDVGLRYFFNAPTIWATDVARYLLLFIFFTSLAPALQSGHHVAVDLFDRLLPAWLLRLQPSIGGFLIIAFGLVLTWQLWRTFVQTVEDDALANSLLVLPLKYFYWIGPLGAAQFVLTAVVLAAGRLPRPAKGID